VQGYLGVRSENRHSNFFLTRGNVGNKGGFGGTGEFIGGAGRSSQIFYKYFLKVRSKIYSVCCHVNTLKLKG